MQLHKTILALSIALCAAPLLAAEPASLIA